MQALVTRVNLIRHGQCDDEAFLRGSTDSVLSQQGWQQMQQAIHSLAKPELILSSPAQRCQTFATHYFDSVQILPLLQERHFGDWDGLSLARLQASYPKELDAYFADPFGTGPSACVEDSSNSSAFTIPNAESLTDFGSRVAQLWEEVIRLAAHHQAQQVHIFTHGGVMRLLSQQVLGMDDRHLFQIKIDYAARLSIDIYHSDAGAFSQFVELCQGRA